MSLARVTPVTQGFGTFTRGGGQRLGFRSGDVVVDLGEGSLDILLPQGRTAWERATEAGVAAAAAGDAMPLADVHALLPFTIADYVDFYSSLEHATNIGRMFRPESEPLLPNWRHLPVGYHGRAGTVVVSGTPLRRPRGQSKAEDSNAPTFGPSRRLDLELEVGFVVGVPSARGEPVPASAFREHVFGLVLVNDWSARDLQAWEYVPLGPFLGKSFATSISAWVTPLALLEDRRVAPPAQDPQPLPHLRAEGDWALDLPLEIELNGTVISRGNADTLYWTMPQQLAHATSNGASVRTGDLMASGTISGGERGSEGSLIELSRNGSEPIRVGDGTTRTFLEDGDEVVLRGEPLGEVCGRIEPA
ncbi:MAG TPA: fumarylacetoacetase [Gaiellaceae bacterium]|nr:fumarylacetoacetase [Gaiellaceae bacterium]